MTATFTFVSVKLTKSNAQIRRRGAGIAAEDRMKIRSLAARNPGGRSPAAPITKQGQGRVHQIREKKSPETSDPEYSSLSENPIPSKLHSEDEEASETQSSSSSGDGGSNPCSRRFINLQTLNKHNEESRHFVRILTQQLPQHLKSEALDPFWTFCIPYFPLVSELIDHRIKFLTPAIPELDMSVSGNLDDRICLRFFTQFMEIPYFLWGQLLYAAGHMRATIEESSGFDNATVRQRQLLENEELILWVKGCTINALNKTFDQELTEVELNGRISTVMTLAAFEKCFGNPELYDSHINGVRQLIGQIGGMANVTPLNRTLMNWLAGTSTSLSECFPDTQLHEIQPSLNELATDIIAPPNDLVNAPEIGGFEEISGNCPSTSFATGTKTLVDNYPYNPFSTLAEQRWMSFASHLNEANLRGSSGDNPDSLFVLERGSRGIVIARSRT